MMEDLERGEVRQFTSGIVHKYYCEKDLAYILSVLTPDAVWPGAGENVRAGLSRASDFLRGCIERLAALEILEERYHTTRLPGGLYLCEGALVLAESAAGRRCARRASFVVRRAGNALRCCYFHFENLYEEARDSGREFGGRLVRQREKALECVAEQVRDGLTGLYTKEAGVRMVEEFMARRTPGLPCCLMLLDMDYFERVNEEEGAVFADAVLQEVASILCAETGEDDVQTRLGGDEFMIFVKNCTGERAMRVGPRIAGLVRSIFTRNGKAPMSASIGMCAAQEAEEYSVLYRRAESTLQFVKENARGQAVCYQDASNELGTALTQLYTQAHAVNEIRSIAQRREEDLTSFALELLGAARNLDDALFLLLARIGKSCNFDRVSIMEVNREYLSYRFSCQWARFPSDLQTDVHFYLSAQDFEASSRMYDGEGLCENNLNESVSRFPSCLHAGVWSCGAYAGSLSFESLTPDYPWSPPQRKLLKELVKIIFSFVMKARADALSQAKTDFLSRISHEIRTPMNAISGMTTIAKTVLDDREKALDCLNKIEQANRFLLDLINDVLDMSRIESGKIEFHMENVDVSRQMESLRALLAPQADQKKVRFTLENKYLGPLVRTDALRLNQILVNIISNAIKFTAPGGEVYARIEQLSRSEAGVCLRFSVRDTGVGIRREAITRIFNAFEQAGRETSSQYGGSGLGLSISSRLVQMMGGALKVTSEPGVGSEFYFTLSLEYGGEGAGMINAAFPARSSDRHSFKGKTLLLAEDNEINREIAVAILEMNGFEVETAEDGRKALMRFVSHAPGYYDAILMDIRMPVMDGLEATRRIRTSGKRDARSVPVIAMTANAFDEDAKKSMESGMNGHLSKPIDIERLLNVLEECLKGV